MNKVLDSSNVIFQLFRTEGAAHQQTSSLCNKHRTGSTQLGKAITLGQQTADNSPPRPRDTALMGRPFSSSVDKDYCLKELCIKQMWHKSRN